MPSQQFTTPGIYEVAIEDKTDFTFSITGAGWALVGGYLVEGEIPNEDLEGHSTIYIQVGQSGGSEQSSISFDAPPDPVDGVIVGGGADGFSDPHGWVTNSGQEVGQPEANGIIELIWGEVGDGGGIGIAANRLLLGI